MDDFDTRPRYDIDSGRSPRRPVRAGGDPTTILVLGILGVAVCGLIAPFAWMKGNEYERECRLLRIEPDPMARIGRILGIVGTGLLCLGLFASVAWMILATAMFSH